MSADHHNRNSALFQEIFFHLPGLTNSNLLDSWDSVELGQLPVHENELVLVVVILYAANSLLPIFRDLYLEAFHLEHAFGSELVEKLVFD